MDDRNMWIDIITKLYKDLHTSDRVMRVAKESDKKRDRVLKYFDKLEYIHEKVALSKRESDLKLLERFYHNIYVIKPENIPDSYFEHERQIMRQRGYGDIEITPERKEILVKQIIEDQEASLDKWIEYFLFDEESKHYEMWEKYWVFQGLQQLGKFNKETGKFSKRDKHTVYPFPPVEREAIFTTLKLMEDYIKDKKGDAEIRSALGSGNFKTLYEYAIKMIMNKGETENTSNEGKWIKYQQGTDYHILRDSLQGYYTGWCTAAGENFAKGQLENGDFYVYYSLDENGEAKVPRIAIRMNGHYEIGEIRGIADNQNMEPEMMPILDKKLEEFPDRDKYRKKEYDMQFLTTIEEKSKKGYSLSREELIFLYELKDKIVGFGYEKDPRIEEIKNSRNLQDDYAYIFDHKEKFWDGNLDLFDLTSVYGLMLPENVSGDLLLDNLTSAEGVILPDSIGGTLYLRELESAKRLVLPEKLGGLDLSKLTSAEDLNLPKSINGELNLRGLRSAEGLVLPEKVDGLNLGGLRSTEGLVLPKEIEGSLNLWNLTNADGLVLPKKIGGNLMLGNLISAEGLTFPEKVGGKLSLISLENAKGLVLPEYIGGSLFLDSLKSSEGLILPKKIEGSLDLDELVKAEGLVFPKYIGFDINLKSLSSAKDIVFPEYIGGYLDLQSLTNAEGLILPEYVGTLYLNSLNSVKGVTLPKFIKKKFYLLGLTSAEGLVLPKDFDMSKLIAPSFVKDELNGVISDKFRRGRFSVRV